MTTRDDADGVGGLDLFCDVCTEERGVDLETLKQTIRLAVEIAREGREGRKIGTMFVVSDAEETLRQSTCLILDPLQGHPNEQKNLDDPNMRETVKELTQLDGAFVVSDDGIVLSAPATSTPPQRALTCRWDWAAGTWLLLPSPDTLTPSLSSSRRARWCVSWTTARS